MKSKIFLAIVGALLSTGSNAQTKFSEGISKVKGEQFKIEYTGLDRDLIVVYNVKSKHADGGPISDNPNAFPLKQEDIHFDVPAARAVIQKVLKPKNVMLHQNEEFVNVGITFERSGRISDIGYGLKKGTVISLEEIAEIDALIRKSITASFTVSTSKDYKFLIYDLGNITF
jgi:hypothetical protein